MKWFVYVIWARDEDGEEVRYYGHTHDMKQREDNHVGTYNAWVRAGRPDKLGRHACSSVFVLDMKDWNMDVLHELDCDEEEASRVEGNYIRYNKCVNRYVAGRTQVQYYQDNRETILQQVKQRHQTNKERNNERSRQYSRQYYQDNCETISQKAKQRHQTNKEQNNERSRQHYYDNRDALNAKKAVKEACPCGALVRHDKMAQHLRTQKHAKRMQQSTSSS